jgi:glycerol kinase
MSSLPSMLATKASRTIARRLCNFACVRVLGVFAPLCFKSWMNYVLAIDQGTTSTRALLFDAEGGPVATAQHELRQHYPEPGWVEHDPEQIWNDCRLVCREALASAGIAPVSVAAIGIANQRETSLLWDRATGLPLHRAIVWQDRRTAGACRDLIRDGAEPMVAEKTGLLIDPYFSATKLAWLLDHVPGARERAARGELCFGTVDSFLLYRLTGGAVHATDATNAARTMLYDIRRQDWDDELLRLFRVPRAILPEVRDNDAVFGLVNADFLGAPIAITGMAGDQQAALIGQGCFAPGTIKSTYGTGCFALMNIGAEARASRHRLLTTIAYRLGGRPVYAIEGSIFVAGAAVQWLRDGLHAIADAAATARLAAEHDHAGVYLVPAFAGLGAPHWLPEARGAIFGLTRDTGPPQLARAALEAVCYQTRDLLDAIASDGGLRPAAMRVDGGMARNDWMLQFLADMLDLPVERPALNEATAFGAASLAAAGAGLCASPDRFGPGWRLERRFSPAMKAERRAALYDGWRRAVDAVKGFAASP